MNSVSITGRLTRTPEIRYIDGTNPMAMVRFTLAVARRIRREGQPDADFISCVAFGKLAEFVDRYFSQGMKMELNGHIQTGRYTAREGHTVYTTDVIADEIAFGESKRSSAMDPAPEASRSISDDDFMSIPDGIEENLPFN